MTCLSKNKCYVFKGKYNNSKHENPERSCKAMNKTRLYFYAEFNMLKPNLNIRWIEIQKLN